MTGWTYLREDGPELSEADRARADAMAKRLTALRDADERAGWASRRRFDEDDGGPEFEPCGSPRCEPCQKGDDEACIEQQWARFDAHPRQIAAQAEAEIELERDWLYTQLDQLGVRMMRPYEHWNEEERYREMAESGSYPWMAA